ncbi:hypothetical protein NBRC116601_09340 [Cognatishimia sp. WU-CL00825]|uniref:MerR family transcriptional regulator n=1 Tax=Cognatishimia sp. WU-CL00825 TaxID=3127658 RepID=UPI0031092B66
MAKSKEAFRTISEVADWLETQPHVLRFWESKFTQVRPVKRAGGRRYYRPADMRLIGGIKKLLHDDGMTIKGVQKLLREQGIKEISALSRPLTAKPGEILDLSATEMPEETTTPDDVTIKVSETVAEADSADIHQAAPVASADTKIAEPDLPEPELDAAETKDPAQDSMEIQAPLVDPIARPTAPSAMSKPAPRAVPRKPMADDISGWETRRKVLASLVKIDHIPDENRSGIAHAISQLKSLQARLDDARVK